MTILVLGLVLFLGIHLVPTSPALRMQLAGRLGEHGYRGGFSAMAAIGLILIVVGYGIAPPGPQLFEPLHAARVWAPAAMVLSFILLAAANMRTHLRRVLRHPMLIGVGLWALVHLLANGSLRATILFGAFLAYVVLDFASATARHAVKTFSPAFSQDVIAVAAGTVLALLVMALHGWLFGVAVMPFPG
ncbi:MAG TPA: NnrU family protein [Noviherbaspirillum sp.]|nr:NnrU family protein [Noviherbaspirillum sp.]